MRNNTNLKLWTALITPFTDDGKVDFETLQKLISQQENVGNGLLILGSTGEALNLDQNEKKEIINFVTSLELKSPLMVGIGGFNLPETASWLQWLEKQNKINSYLMVTPLYAKPGEEGQYHWFKALMDISSRPAMLYNIPSRSGISLNLKTLQRLENHPALWAIKEASGNIQTFETYRKAVPSLKLFSGNDEIFYRQAECGADGLVSVASNVWPEATRIYVRQSLEKKLTDIKLWECACNALFLASNPVPVKALLYANKNIQSPVTRPPLSHLDLVNITSLLEFNNEIKNWLLHNKE